MEDKLSKTIGGIEMKLDRIYSKLYCEDKNNQIQTYELLNDYSKTNNKLEFGDYILTHQLSAVKDMYTILNEYYNSKLSELISEGDSEEISKLKYLHLILLNIKSILNDN